MVDVEEARRPFAGRPRLRVLHEPVGAQFGASVTVRSTWIVFRGVAGTVTSTSDPMAPPEPRARFVDWARCAWRACSTLVQHVVVVEEGDTGGLILTSSGSAAASPTRVRR